VHLRVKIEAAIIELLQQQRAEGHIVLVSTHDLGAVPGFCDQVVLINRTVLATGPTQTTFTEANLTRAFAGALSSEVEPEDIILAGISGRSKEEAMSIR